MVCCKTSSKLLEWLLPLNLFMVDKFNIIEFRNLGDCSKINIVVYLIQYDRMVYDENVV